MSLEIVPMTFSEANEFVRRFHRHHGKVVGMKFAIGCSDGERIVGVALVGRPVSRQMDNGWTLEVNRCCTDGTKNACSALYSASWRAARSLGYRRLVTYTMQTESGSSLRASGWKIVGETSGLSWDREKRPRVDKHELGKRYLWDRRSGRAECRCHDTPEVRLDINPVAKRV